jgi:ubiquinone/menaquinone biosynthesis C-methylase UbiE
MDAEHMTFSDASFDYVLCGFAIFLFPHLEQVLSEFFRVLRPGGKLGITIARSLDALSQWYGECITAYHTRYHFPLSAGSGEGSNYAALPHHLTNAGFINIQVLTEQTDFVYANAQEWWGSRWTHGPRYALEQMAPEVLAQFKEEVFSRLAQEIQSQRIHETLDFQYIVAEKKI